MRASTNAPAAPAAPVSIQDSAGIRLVPLFPAAADSARQGFVRVINRSDQLGEVVIVAHDDSAWDYEPLTLSIGASETIHFNSDDLEQGNVSKGLTGSTGVGEGDWRLELSSELDIEVLSYIRTNDGFLTSMHDIVPAEDGQHRVAVFNPGSNTKQQSLLRLVNRGDAGAEVTVRGIDDSGESTSSEVAVTVAAGRSLTLTAQQLESGGEDFEGALGDGAGKWQLVLKSDRPIVVMSLLLSPTGHLTNLSTAPGRSARPEPTQSVEDVFRLRISPIVQSKCINCHVDGGASGDTRLVFVRDTEAGHEATNLGVFRDFLATVENGASRILNKIQGVDHGGGIQVAAGSEEFESMRTFLDLLTDDGDVNRPTITAKELFTTVRMEGPRRTLYRAALIFAGRIPTADELAPFPGGTIQQLRDTIRGMMTGPAFHQFLIRGANDRLLTDSLRGEDILANGQSGVIQDDDGARFLGFESERERLQAGGRSTDGRYSDEYYRWLYSVRYGARQAPSELIAHMAENDLPYTEILTADYIMANAATAKAYDAPVTFDDPTDPHEFRPARIRGYRRHGVTMDEYPHAGILNTTSFLRRYPTTPTNRNRARARWAYLHFLGVDIQNSAPTVTDADALLDTRNPTMHNPACTVCHIPLDPVSGAFQNYTETGFYRATVDGKHALDWAYEYPFYGAKFHRIEPSGSQEREAIVAPGVPMTRESRVFLRLMARNLDQDLDTIATIVVGAVSLRDRDTGERYTVDLGLADDNVTTLSETGETVVYMQTNDFARVPVDIPADARYDIIAEVWAEDTGETGEFAVTAGLYWEGDTWYRDMREPGFDGATAPEADASVRWLAERMAEDPRFAEGAVKFWWPAIMGSEVALPPAEGDPEFEARLLGATAQANEVARSARKFRLGFYAGDRTYNLKDLLAGLVLSPWFRAERTLTGDSLRDAALRTAGARRLLTPEELALKTASVTGFQWGRRISLQDYNLDEPATSALTRDYELLYGGIDSVTKMARTRDVTSVMAAVAGTHAVRSSCPIVLREFYLLPEERRRLFAGIGIDTDPETAGAQAIRRKLAELHFKFYGIEIGPYSEDIDATFALFVETLSRKRGDQPTNTAFPTGTQCDTASDLLLLEDVVDPPIVAEGDGYDRRYVQNDPDGLLNKTYEDPDHLARTWVVVLAYLMMDYRYLYL